MLDVHNPETFGRGNAERGTNLIPGAFRWSTGGNHVGTTLFGACVYCHCRTRPSRIRRYQPIGGSTDRTPEASTAGPDGTLQKTHGDWRSAQLVGAAVYNDKDVNVGTIENLLVGSDGKVDHVVLSVGGFLGIGSKYVSVPFDQLKFEKSQRSAVRTPISGQPNGSNGPSSAEPICLR